MPGLSRNWLAHFLDHRAAGAADRGHAHRAEQIGQQRAEQQADDDVRVRQAEQLVEVGRDADRAAELAKVGGIGAEQHQRGKAGRTDRIALGHRLGGVADRVEGVGACAHVLLEARHFGDSAGIVGNRAVGVERDDHAGQRKHRRSREGDAEEAGELVSWRSGRR